MSAPTAPLPGESDTALLDHLVERLHERLPDHAPESLRAQVEASLDRYADAPVRSFLPIIVERDVVARLQDA